MRKNKTRFILMAATLIMASAILSGCSGYSVAGTDSSTEAATDAKYEEIIDEMDNMGITGETVGETTAERMSVKSETEFGNEIDRSVWIRGVDEYVRVETDAGNTYYGAVIDGKVEVWDANEPYAKSLLPNADEYEGNTVIQVIATDDYSGDIALHLYNYDTEEETDVTLTKEDNYAAGMTLSQGDWVVQDYTVAESFRNDHFIEMNLFTVGDSKTVAQLKMFTGED